MIVYTNGVTFWNNKNSDLQLKNLKKLPCDITCHKLPQKTF